MGPLVPDVIGNELNFVVAFFVGIAFGFILEQAGFSTSKKLVGLFYGYDFTVLRVFFTGGVTAMIGVIVLGHYGLLDVNLIYINPTFLYSALVGGLIMGLGFVVGGYCPGTSICAMAIGKIDAMLFVAGSFIGVFIFAEGYPLFEGLYKAANWGSPRIFESLGMSQSIFAFLLVAVAIGAFWAITYIENKVNGTPNPEFGNKKLYVALSGLALVIGLSAFALPDRKVSLLDQVNNSSVINGMQVEYITSDELAFRLLDNDKSLQLFDLRDAESNKKGTLPRAQNITLENLFEKDLSKVLLLRHKKNIFFAKDEVAARKAIFIAHELGFSNLYLLKGGYDEFAKDIINYSGSDNGTTKDERDTHRFRAKAKDEMNLLIKNSKSSGGEKKKTKRVVGGC